MKNSKFERKLPVFFVDPHLVEKFTYTVVRDLAYTINLLYIGIYFSSNEIFNPKVPRYDEN